jgi:hypothetical protein
MMQVVIRLALALSTQKRGWADGALGESDQIQAYPTCGDRIRPNQTQSNRKGPAQLEMKLDLNLTLPTNMNRKGNLLTPTLSSTSVWRRGRWNGACGFWRSMREILRPILFPRRGNTSTRRWENPTKSNHIKPPAELGLGLDSGRRLVAKEGADFGRIALDQTGSNLRGE